MTDRVLRSEKEEAYRLGLDPKTLAKYAKTGKITYIWVGKRRKYDDTDERGFIERQRMTCAYSNEKARHTSTSISSGTVLDFQALRRKRTGAKQSSA